MSAYARLPRLACARERRDQRAPAAVAHGVRRAAVTDDELRELLPVLATEVNIKQIEIATSGDARVTLEAKPNVSALGKKFGKKTPLAADAVSSFSSAQLREFLNGEELVVTVEGDTRALDVDDLTIVRRASGDLIVEEEHGFFAAIDPTITPELKAEGWHVNHQQLQRMRRMRVSRW